MRKKLNCRIIDFGLGSKEGITLLEWQFPVSDKICHMSLGKCTGNPWVSQGLPIPESIRTCTHIPMGSDHVGRAGGRFSKGIIYYI